MARMALLRHPLLWIAGVSSILAIVLYFGWQEIAQAFRQADPLIMLGLALLQIITLGMAAYQWRFLLHKLGRRLSFLRVFSIHLAGGFVESVTPSVKLGGEAVKLFLFRQATALPHRELAGAMLAHKYLSLFPFVLLCAPFIILAALRQEVPAPVYVAFMALAAVFALIFWLLHCRPERRMTDGPIHSVPPTRSRRPFATLASKIHGMTSFLNDGARHSRALTVSAERGGLLLISLLIWGLYPAKVYVVTLMLGYDINFLYVALATYTAYLVSMLPLFPGGLGSFEGSMALMLSLGGISPAEGLAVALLARIITYWFPLVFSAAASGALLWTNFKTSNSTTCESTGGTSAYPAPSFAKDTN